MKTINSIRNLSRRDWGILIGTILEHYDIALYGFLVPVISQLFWPESDNLSQLIKGYSIYLTSIITRPLGIFVFSGMAEKHGPIYTLYITFVGIALSMIAMCCLPSYNNVGIIAPYSLICVRMLLSFFVAGESSISKIFIFEDKNQNDMKFVSYFAFSASMFGTMLASLTSVIVISVSDYFINAWRYAFFFGGLIGVVGLYFRISFIGQNIDELSLHTKLQRKIFNLQILIRAFRSTKGILKVGFASGFSYILYGIPFILLNNFVPLVTDISYIDMMSYNTVLLMFDVIAIFIVGFLSSNFNPNHVMMFASLLLAITIIPIFHFIPNMTFFYVNIARLWLALCYVIYSIYLRLWYLKQFPSENRYICVGIGTIIGGSLIGKLTLPISLYLWSLSHSDILPGVYIAAFALINLLVLKYSN